MLACHDCGLPYSDPAWVEAVVPHNVWNDHLSPKGNEGGILCINCMAKRAVDEGLTDVPVMLTAGPFVVSVEWQAMEFAPLDRPVLAWWPHLERPVIAWISRGGASIGKWTFASFKFEHQTPVIAPTHWAELPAPPAIADTHPKDGDVEQAPLMSGGGGEANRPNGVAQLREPSDD